MPATTPHSTRRLLLHYALAGIASLLAVAIGAVALRHDSDSSANDPGLMRQLDVASARVAQELTDNDEATTGQDALRLLDVNPRVTTCAVVSPDGVYLAHSDSRRVGLKAARRHGVLSAGETTQWIRADSNGRPMFAEFEVPLRATGDFLGVLQVQTRVVRNDNWMDTTARFGPIVMLIPLVVLLIGGRLLGGSMRSTSNIDGLLRGVAEGKPAAEIPLLPVETGGSVAEGWNALVEQVRAGELLQNLESRLSQSLGGFQEKKSEQILHSLSDGIALTDANGRISFANSALAVLLNVGDQSMGEKVLLDLLPLGLGHNLANGRALRDSTRPVAVELQWGSALENGVLRVSRSPLRTSDAGASTHVWCIRDITQQRLIERTRDQFVDTATHELRTPLANIKACAETLELNGDVDLETQKKYLNTINTEATRLGRFVDEFLNISRMEAGSIVLNRHETDLARLFEEAIEKVRPQMDLKGIEFQIKLPPKLPRLQLDKDKINAALVNLLGNAAKYTPEHGRVSLYVEPVDHELQIHIEDNGIGIAPDEISRVFNKFFRSEDQRIRNITGTGLGLSFAQEVVRLHGGRIKVHSELNKGSKFTMVLTAV